VTFPGALGRMLNDELCRDKLFAVLGPEKRGKSFWLNEIAFRASLARRNVALFQIGDMSKEQVIVRLGVRLTGRSNRKRYCEEHPSPVPDCLLNQLGTCERRKRSRSSIIEKRGVKTIHEAYESGVEHEPCTKCSKEFDFRGSFWYESIPDVKTLTWRETFKAGQKFLSRIRGRDFRLSAHASDQLSVSGLKLILDNWESFDGFVPDVIVIDYADNLAPESEDARKDVRHQENHKWKMLRGLSLERHCLVATATQAASRGYGKVSLEMDDYSEDKRKHGHVTAEIGLNQTLDEKRAKLMRINFIVQREGEFFSEDSVVVGMDLGRGRPVLFSYRG